MGGRDGERERKKREERGRGVKVAQEMQDRMIHDPSFCHWGHSCLPSRTYTHTHTKREREREKGIHTNTQAKNNIHNFAGSKCV